MFVRKNEIYQYARYTFAMHSYSVHCYYYTSIMICVCLCAYVCVCAGAYARVCIRVYGLSIMYMVFVVAFSLTSNTGQTGNFSCYFVHSTAVHCSVIIFRIGDN